MARSKNLFSHITVSDRMSMNLEKTLCGSYVTGSNLLAVWYEGSLYARPLCPKCAALKLIAETTTEAK